MCLESTWTESSKSTQIASFLKRSSKSTPSSQIQLQQTSWLKSIKRNTKSLKDLWRKSKMVWMSISELESLYCYRVSCHQMWELTSIVKMECLKWGQQLMIQRTKILILSIPEKYLFKKILVTNHYFTRSIILQFINIFRNHQRQTFRLDCIGCLTMQFEMRHCELDHPGKNDSRNGWRHGFGSFRFWCYRNDDSLHEEQENRWNII